MNVFNTKQIFGKRYNVAKFFRLHVIHGGGTQNKDP